MPMLPDILPPLASVELAAVALLIFFGVVAASVAAVVWLAVMLVRGVVALTVSLFTGRPPQPRRPRLRAAEGPCPDPMCRRINPRAAAYCRQCGRLLPRS